MKRFLFGLVACGLLAAITMGRGDATRARMEVAREAAVKKLDNFLGSLDVKRKEIELALKSLKEARNCKGN